MIVTPERNRRNRRDALAVAVLMAVTSGIVGWFFHPVLVVLGLCPFVFRRLRRRCLRRLAVMKQPFSEHWERTLRSHVAFFGALDDSEKERFRQLIKVFLDEVRITGIRTDVDDTIRVLVAAGAVIPIFGFHDWEYHRLSEVLIYPTSFGVKSPDVLQKQDPGLYRMLRDMFHQDTSDLLKLVPKRRRRYGRNAPCPCGSGKKYKMCCLLNGERRTPDFRVVARRTSAGAV